MDIERGEVYVPRRTKTHRRKRDVQDQFVTRKAGGGNLADIGGGRVDNLVQSALCHLAMGKAGYEFKIAFAKGKCYPKPLSSPRIKEFGKRIS